LVAGRRPQIAAEAAAAQGGSEHMSERMEMRERASGGSNAAMRRIGERDVVGGPAAKV
jgi:hypothetical protein